MHPEILGKRNHLAVALAALLICVVVAAIVAGVAGYYIGHSGGYNTGYSEGYNRGRSEGLAAGAERAYREGYTAGYNIGYTYGFSNGTLNVAKALYMGLKDRIMREIVQVSAPNLPSKIKVGCLMALTGELGPMGVEIAKGAQLAVALVNRLGGVAGRPVELILEDTGTDPSKALTACKKLVEVDGVQVIVGPMASGEVMAIGSYVNERKVVLISPSATSPYITLNFPDDYVFRVVGSDTAQAKALVKLTLDAGCKKIATLVLDNPYGVGRGMRESIRRDAENLGLDIVGIHWVLRGVSGVHLTSPDPSVRGRTESYLRALVDFCSDIGGRIIVFGSPAQRSIPRGVDPIDAWMWAVDIFRRCSQYAEQHGVYICIEPLRRDMTNFINTVDEAIKLIEDVGHPNFRLILDVYAMTGVDEPIDRQIEKGGAYLMHLHANDDNMGGPGFGSADYRAVVRGLRNIGFKGYVSVEILRREENPAEAVKISIENLKKFFREY